jgi:predicted metal-dependent hydrolase
MAQEGEARTLSVSDETLDYTLCRTGRRRTIGIFVEPDRRVTVLVPVRSDTESVERILRRRLRWIRRQRQELEALPPPLSPRQWVNGETHRYLGRQYRLKIGEGPVRSVTLSGGYFRVTLQDAKDRNAIRKLMDSWYGKRSAHGGKCE